MDLSEMQELQMHQSIATKVLEISNDHYRSMFSTRTFSSSQWPSENM